MRTLLKNVSEMHHSPTVPLLLSRKHHARWRYGFRNKIADSSGSGFSIDITIEDTDC